MARDTAAGWALLTFKAFCVAVIMASTLYTIYLVGPPLETRYYPAVSKLRILSVSADEEGNAVVQAEFKKLRGECEYLGIAWFKGKPDGEFERVPVVLMRREGDTSSPNRPEGVQRAGPWLVGIPVSEIATNSFSVLYHRCHPFWTSRTDFYP